MYKKSKNKTLKVYKRKACINLKNSTFAVLDCHDRATRWYQIYLSRGYYALT